MCNFYLGKPKIDEPSTLIDESLFADEKKTFSCVASGNPIPWVQWISIDSDVKLTAIAKKEIVMTVEKMNKSYIGNYSCKAWNSFGITEKRLLSLRLRPQGWLEILFYDLAGFADFHLGMFYIDFCTYKYFSSFGEVVY